MTMLTNDEKTKMSQTLDLLSKTAEQMTGPELRQLRLLRGLQVWDARTSLGLEESSEFLAIESARRVKGSLTPTLIKKLNALYNLPQPRPTMYWETSATQSATQQATK